MKFALPPALKVFSTTPSTFRGMAFMLASAMSDTAMIATVHHLSSDIHPFEIAFFRLFFGFLILTPVFFRQGFKPLRTRRLGLHALRGAVRVVSTLMGFTALSLIPLATFSALNFSGPLFGTLFAFLILNEVIRARRLTALAVGLAGALVILRPGLVEISPGALLAFGAAILWGAQMIVLKTISRTDSSLTATLYLSIFVAPFALLASLPFWRTPSWEELAWLVAMGLFGSGRQLCMAQAVREADVSAVLPLDFTKLVWASIIGYLVFSEVPDVWAWAGGIVIFAAVIYVSQRENRTMAAGTKQ